MVAVKYIKHTVNLLNKLLSLKVHSILLQRERVLDYEDFISSSAQYGFVFTVWDCYDSCTSLKIIVCMWLQQSFCDYSFKMTLCDYCDVYSWCDMTAVPGQCVIAAIPVPEVIWQCVIAVMSMVKVARLLWSDCCDLSVSTEVVSTDVITLSPDNMWLQVDVIWLLWCLRDLTAVIWPWVTAVMSMAKVIQPPWSDMWLLWCELLWTSCCDLYLVHVI